MSYPMSGNMPGLMPNTGYGSGKDFQQDNTLRRAERANAVTEATAITTASGSALQERFRATNYLARNLPGMTHNYRAVPYPTATQHMVQKRLTHYTPIFNQWSSLLPFGSFGFMRQSPSSVEQNFSYQPSTIPRNPTYSLMPAASAVQYRSSNLDLNTKSSSQSLTSASDVTPDLNPIYNEIIPHGNTVDDRRITIPVHKGTILAPFRIEHTPTVSYHSFTITPTVHNMLLQRSDLDVLLQCFYHEDTNWPSSIKVSVNGTPLFIGNETLHKPLFLKQICKCGVNIIEITTTACCSHLFSLLLVHRPTVSSVVRGVVDKQLLSIALAKEKIKKNFPIIATSEYSALNVIDGISTVKVSVLCPSTCREMILPARGQACLHIQCFDLDYYIKSNSERGTWKCPICNKPTRVQDLEVDEYMWEIIINLMNADVEEFTIDSEANWKLVQINSCEEENDGGVRCPLCSNFVPPEDVELHIVMCLTKPGVTYNEMQCPVCSKNVLPDDLKCHLVMCLTKPSYREDVLEKGKGECPICMDELTTGAIISRLSCLCVYHKTCIDGWFKIKSFCPLHPVDQDTAPAPDSDLDSESEILL